MGACAMFISLAFVTSVAACVRGTSELGPTEGELPIVSLAEEMRIDGHEQDLVPIDTAVRVAVARDGTIAIAQRRNSEIRFFTAQGEPVGRFGMRGDGPGKFTSLWRLGWMGGDTLFAYDFNLRRFTLIDAALQYVRDVPVPNGARPSAELADRLPEFASVYGGVLYADGSVYAEVTRVTSLDVKEYDPTQRVYGRVAADGTIVSYSQLPRERLFGTGLILKLSDDGAQIVYLQSDVDGRNAGTFEVTVEEVGGDTLYVRRYPFEVRLTDQPFLDSLNDARFDGEGIPESVKIPPMLPAPVSLLPGIDRSLWIQLRESAKGRPYRVHDADGNPLGLLMLPPEQKLAVASLEHVWLIERDEFGVESVVRCRVLIGG